MASSLVSVFLDLFRLLFIDSRELVPSRSLDMQ
jgi:hypothetical protein